MALIKCTECGKDISDKAGSCPGCGYQNKLIKSNNKICLIFSMLSFLFACSFFINIRGTFFLIAYLILGILGILFNKYGAYLKIAGMVYVVFALIALLGISGTPFMIYIFSVNVIYAIIFLVQGIKVAQSERTVIS